MAEEPPAPPPAPVFLDEQTAVERIQAIVGNARTVWFALIAFLAFIGLTLTSVRDLDFFSATATTQLPIVNIAIPTTTFFWSAAWLAAVLHTYFHLYLLKLWDVLAEAPPTIGGAPLGDRIFPWLVLDDALRRRPDRPTTSRPMDWLARFVTWLVIWLATPLMLAAFWWRSMPAHDARLTLAIGAPLLLSLFATQCSLRHSERRLVRPGLGDTRAYWHRTGPMAGLGRGVDRLSELLFWFNRILAVPLIALGSLIGAGVHHLPAIANQHVDAYWPSVLRRPPIFMANLSGSEIVEKPADWIGRDTAERRFRITWCRDRQIPADACELPTEPYQTAARKTWCGTRSIEGCAGEFRRLEAAFAEEWQEQRSEYLASLKRPDLRGRDLRNAHAPGAFLAGVDLREARLEGTDFWRARLEGADLTWALLEGANLVEARLEGANLSVAQLDRADLWSARLEGTNLGEARLVGVNLVEARLQRANLRKAQLQGANLGGAQLGGTDLGEAQLQSAEWSGATLSASPAHSADFTDGRNLTQSQLAQVIGDNKTILPLDAETGVQLYVWTCWSEPPPTLDGLLRHWPESDHDRLRSLWLCPPGVAPERTGRPATSEPGYPLAD